MTEPPKSKLDRELEEILTRKAQEPIRLSDRRNARQREARQMRLQANTERWSRQATRLLSMPIVVAYALALVGWLVRDVSGLLALLLCTAAVVAIWLPGIRRLGGWSSPSSDVQYWRGRPYVSSARDAVSRSPIDSIKRYFDRHR